MSKGRRKINDNFFGGNMNFITPKKIVCGLLIILLIVVIIMFSTCGNDNTSTKKRSIKISKVNEKFTPKKYNFTVTDEIQITSDFIKSKTNGRISSIESSYIAYCTHKYAPKFGLDVSFVIAKMYAESGIDASQVNATTGAMGILQVLDDGIGYDVKTKKFKIVFDKERLHDIDYGIWAGLMVFKDKMEQVKVEIRKNPKIKNKRNQLVMAMTKYVGASSEKGKKIAREYTERILRVQAEYVLFRATYCKDSAMYFNDETEE